MAFAPVTIKEIIKKSDWFDSASMEVYSFRLPKSIRDNGKVNKITILIESTANNFRKYGSNEPTILWRTGAMRIFYPDSQLIDDYERVPMLITNELRKYDYSVTSIYGPNYTPDTEQIYTRLPYQKYDFKEDLSY